MRDWEPVEKERLEAIIRDTAKDSPFGDYCADEVYRLAREVERHRAERAAAETPRLFRREVGDR
jgi:hypothetical protein